MEHCLLLMQILIINLVLSGDNAVVIAMASQNLPVQKRKLAVWWGAFGAVIMRIVLSWIAVILLKIPFIQAAGALLLVLIAIKLLVYTDGEASTREAYSLWSAVQIILAADFIMSLDNVLAIAALAKGDLAILIIGIAISIPIVIWGSNVISDWLQRFPILVYAGAGILGYTAGDMLLNDGRVGWYLEQLAPSVHVWLPATIAGCIIAVGWMRSAFSSK